jgi:hypothetical protein
MPCCTHGVHEETSFTGRRQGPEIAARHAGVDTPLSGKAGEHIGLLAAFSGLWRCRTLIEPSFFYVADKQHDGTTTLFCNISVSSKRWT